MRERRGEINRDCRSMKISLWKNEGEERNYEMDRPFFPLDTGMNRGEKEDRKRGKEGR